MIFRLHITKFSIKSQQSAFSLQNPEHLSFQTREFRPCLPPTVPGYLRANLSSAGCELVSKSGLSLPLSLMFATQLGSWLNKRPRKDLSNEQMPVIQGPIPGWRPCLVSPQDARAVAADRIIPLPPSRSWGGPEHPPTSGSRGGRNREGWLLCTFPVSSSDPMRRLCPGRI